MSLRMLMIVASVMLLGVAHAGLANVNSYDAQCLFHYFTVRNWVWQPFVGMDSAINCLKTAPMNPKIAYNVTLWAQYMWMVHSLRSHTPSAAHLQIMALSDMFENGTEASPDGVTFTATWQGISELEFVHRVTEALLSAEDPHLSFQGPTLFTDSYWVHPYVFASRLNAQTSRQELYITGWSRLWSEELRPALAGGLAAVLGFPSSFDLSRFESEVQHAISSASAITRISGLDVMSEWLPWVLRQYGSSDPGANFNDALRFNFWIPLSLIPGSLLGASYVTDFPTVDGQLMYQTIELADGGVINGIKIVTLAQNLHYPMCDAETHSLKGWEEGGNAKWKPLKNQNRVVPRLAMRCSPPFIPHKELHGMETKRRRTDPVAPTLPPTFKQSKYRVGSFADIMHAYFIPELPLAVVEIKSFLYEGTSSPISPLLDLIDSLWEPSFDSGNKNLLIDLTGNSGGIVDLADLMLQLMFPKKFFIHSGEVRQLAGFNISYVNLENLTSIQAFPFATIVDPVVAGTRDPHTVLGAKGASQFKVGFGAPYYATMTNLTFNVNGSLRPVYTPHDVSSSEGLPLQQERTAIWWKAHKADQINGYVTPYWLEPYLLHNIEASATDTPEANLYDNITIITDGTCGSSCSQFETKIRQAFPSARVFTYGGVKSVLLAPMQTSLFTGGTITQTQCPYLFIPNISYFALYNYTSEPWYWPVDYTANVMNFYGNFSVPVQQATPRQYESSIGTAHWWAWEPNFDQKVDLLFPGFYQPPSSSAPPRAFVSWTTLLLFIFVLCMASSIML